jgi:hypothetical protein
MAFAWHRRTRFGYVPNGHSSNVSSLSGMADDNGLTLASAHAHAPTREIIEEFFPGNAHLTRKASMALPVADIVQPNIALGLT